MRLIVLLEDGEVPHQLELLVPKLVLEVHQPRYGVAQPVQHRSTHARRSVCALGLVLVAVTLQTFLAAAQHVFSRAY
jgi:hypothetical protein